MCDDELRKTNNKPASQQERTGSDELTSRVVNNFADLKATMSEMISNFKTELLTHINESILQVYQDFQQVPEPAAQDEIISVTEVEPLANDMVWWKIRVLDTRICGYTEMRIREYADIAN